MSFEFFVVIHPTTVADSRGEPESPYPSFDIFVKLNNKSLILFNKII